MHECRERKSDEFLLRTMKYYAPEISCKYYKLTYNNKKLTSKMWNE